MLSNGASESLGVLAGVRYKCGIGGEWGIFSSLAPPPFFPSVLRVRPTPLSFTPAQKVSSSNMKNSAALLALATSLFAPFASATPVVARDSSVNPFQGKTLYIDPLYSSQGKVHMNDLVICWMLILDACVSHSSRCCCNSAS